MKKYRFYKKEYDGKVRWWVEIKPWILPERLLIMYPSAEKWLEKIGGGKNELVVTASTKQFPNAETLFKNKFEGPIRGTSYVAKSYRGEIADHEVLLCPVTLYVFGKYPKAIYYQVEES
jgi:hypothetical protein